MTLGPDSSKLLLKRWFSLSNTWAKCFRLPSSSASEMYSFTMLASSPYKSKSGFVFFNRMIYSEVYGESEWWTSMKKMWKRTYIATDEASKKQNATLSKELSEKFSFTYQLLDKYELKENWPSVIVESLNQERYLIDNVVSTTASNQGGNTYSNYYIYDTKEKKQYPIKATTSKSALLDKLIKMIEEN